MAEDLVAKAPVVKTTIIKEPVVKELVVEKPVMEEPVVEESVVKDPVAEEDLTIEAPAVVQQRLYAVNAYPNDQFDPKTYLGCTDYEVTDEDHVPDLHA